MKKLLYVVAASALCTTMVAFAGSFSVTNAQANAVKLTPNPDTLGFYCVTKNNKPFISKTLSPNQELSGINASTSGPCAGKVAFTITATSNSSTADNKCDFLADSKTGQLQKVQNAGLCSNIQLTSDGMLTVK
jgi:hypothetical protein